VLIKVLASSLNPVDIAIRNGKYQQLGPHNEVILGRDFSGIIHEAGPNVKHHEIGQEIMGVTLAASQNGSHAEYILVPEDQIVKKPSVISHIQAASLSYVGYMALRVVEKHVSDGDRVFINGGAGGFGTALIHIINATRKNCQLVVTDIDDYFERLLEIPVELVIAPNQPLDIYITEKSLDCVLDLVGQPTAILPFNLVKESPHSRFVNMRPDVLHVENQPGSEIQFFNESFDFSPIVKPITSTLQDLLPLIETRRIESFIDGVYPISQFVQAHSRLESALSRGKIIFDHEKTGI